MKMEDIMIKKHYYAVSVLVKFLFFCQVKRTSNKEFRPDGNKNQSII